MNERLLESVWLILAAPWQQRRNRKSIWSVGVIAGLCFLGPAALFGWSLLEMVRTLSGARGIAEQLRHTALVASAIAVGVLALAWWASLVANVLEQNQPVLARLVPTHPTRLRVALVTACAAITLAMSLFVFTVAPDDRADPLAVSVVCAGALALLAASVRWPLMWMLGCVAPFVMGTAFRSPMIALALAAIRMHWHDEPLLLAATAFIASGVLLVALIQDGGSRHAANYETRRVRTALFSARARGERPMGVGGQRSFASMLTRPYSGWMARLLADPASSVQGRLALGLGPAAHWTSAVTGIALMLAAVPVGMVVAQGLTAFYPVILHDALPFAISGATYGGLLALLSPAIQAQPRLYQTRREQALLALLPGVPPAGESSRWLARRMTTQFLLTWVGGVVFVVSMGLVGAWLDASSGHSSVQWGCDVAIGTLSLATFQWRAWARLSAPTALNAFGPLLTAMGVATMVAAGQQTGWLPLAASAGMVVIGVSAWCALRWARMGREPAAFPVGRLAR